MGERGREVGGKGEGSGWKGGEGGNGVPPCPPPHYSLFKSYNGGISKTKGLGPQWGGDGDFYIDVRLDQLFCAQFRVSINVYIYWGGGGGGGGRKMDIFSWVGEVSGLRILWIFGGFHKI